MYLWNNYSLQKIPEHQVSDLFQGTGVFETILVTKALNIVLWDEHIQRLRKGAQFLGSNLTINSNSLKEALIKLIPEHQKNTCWRLNLIFLSQRNDLIIRLFPFQFSNEAINIYATKQYFRGNSPHYQFKTLSRIENHHFQKIAQENNCDDFLILDYHANILETCLANVFFVREDGNIETPLAKNMPFLNGIVRQYLVDFQNKMNITCIEKNIPLHAIDSYTQAFITNGLRLIHPVARIGEWHFPDTDVGFSLRNQLLTLI
jgi:branched-subunit amino acid aminotransferase/4-amino-4-deoxychorismate lyase